MLDKSLILDDDKTVIACVVVGNELCQELPDSWLVLLRRLNDRAAFRWSWLVGFLFFLGSIWWLVHLTKFGGLAAVLGWLVLCAYLALYFALFGWLMRRNPAG
jgi:apolipoprotein N-acyltransferase